MKRRDFLKATLGTAVASRPLAAHAQSGRPLIGILAPQPAERWKPNLEALRTALRELGYVEGRNIWLESRYADGELARLPALAAEIVARKPDVVVVGSSAGVLATQRATSTIPVVMVTVADPVAIGVVKSSAQPGGNVTGIWLFGGNDALVGKRIDLLKEIVPAMSQMGVMVAPGDPTDEVVMKLLPAATHALGVTYKTFEVRTNAELEAAFAQVTRDGLQGLFVNQNPFFLARRAAVVALAARAGLPAMYGFREFAEAGGLLAYGPSLPGAYRQVARLVDRVLKGANPADLPVEQADKYELVVNNKTAKALGLKISESFLLRADEVID